VPYSLAIILLGIIEGITEFLPVSSTGHLLIAEHWLPRQSDLFNVVIQCGAVLAVLPLFSSRLRRMFFSWRDPENRDFLLKILLAFGLTGVVGFILEKNQFKLPERLTPIAWAMFVGGLLFVVVELWLRDKPSQTEVTWTVAFFVGVGQLIAAVFPGASRSGATILLALILGVSRPAATEFSFLVGIPTMLAAGGLKIFKAVHHSSAAGAGENWAMLALGALVAAVVSFGAVKWLLKFIQTHTYTGFGWYRIALGGLLLIACYAGIPGLQIGVWRVALLNNH
jgi:undecaprenyl-diphosphatase